MRMVKCLEQVLDENRTTSDYYQTQYNLLESRSLARKTITTLDLWSHPQLTGDGDAATWLPPHKPYRCRYIARQIAVKQKYQLWVAQAEHDAMARVLAQCPEHLLPIGEVL